MLQVAIVQTRGGSSRSPKRRLAAIATRRRAKLNRAYARVLRPCSPGSSPLLNRSPENTLSEHDVELACQDGWIAIDDWMKGDDQPITCSRIAHTHQHRIGLVPWLTRHIHLGN
jgi:hypothetical protein